MKEQRLRLNVDGCGLIVGQKELDVGEFGVWEDVVLTSSWVSDQAVVHQLIVVPGRGGGGGGVELLLLLSRYMYFRQGIYGNNGGGNASQLRMCDYYCICATV